MACIAHSSLASRTDRSKVNMFLLPMRVEPVKIGEDDHRTFQEGKRILCLIKF